MGHCASLDSQCKEQAASSAAGTPNRVGFAGHRLHAAAASWGEIQRKKAPPASSTILPSESSSAYWSTYKGMGEREERIEGKARYTSSCISVENLINRCLFVYLLTYYLVHPEHTETF